MKDSFYFLVESGIYNILLLYTLLYLNSNKRYFYNTKLIWVCAIILCLFGCITSDYYGYIEIIEKLSSIFIYSEIEDVYAILAYYIEYDSSYFRMILTLLIYVLLIRIISKNTNNTQIAVAIYVIIGLMSFNNVLRSALCEVVILTGAFLFYKKGNIFTFVFLILTAFLGYFLHKSSFIVIGLVIISLLPLNKTIIKTVLLISPILVFLGIIIINIIFNKYFDTSTYQTAREFGSGMVVLSSLLTNILVIIIWSAVLVINIDRFNKKNRIIRYTYRYLFWGIMAFGILMFSGVSRYVYERLWVYSLIPFIILLAETWKYLGKKKVVFLGAFIGIWLANNMLLIFNYISKQSALSQHTVQNSINTLF